MSFDGLIRYSPFTGYSAFLVSYDSLGNLRWLVDFNSSFGISATVSIDVEPVSGDVLVGGTYNGTLQIGNITLPGQSGDVYMAKYDHLGNFKWARVGGGYDAEVVVATSLDNSGNCIGTGDFYSDTARFGSDTLFNSISSAIFIIKYNPNGNFLWAKSILGTDTYAIRSVATDSLDNIYLVGLGFDSTLFDGLTLVAEPIDSNGYIFVAKYDPMGNPLWVKKVSSPQNFWARSIAVKNDGTFYIGADYRTLIDFGDTVVQGPAGTFTDENFFIAEFDNQGNTNWVRFPQSINDPSIIYAVAIDNKGEVFAGGQYEGLLDIGPPTITSNAGTQDIFLTKWYTPETSTSLIENESFGRFEFYPNPSSGQFIIESDCEGNCAYVLSDLTGRLIQQGEIQNRRTVVSVEKALNGLFLLELRSEGYSLQKKILLNN
jgi:hypothetical protein